MPATDTGEERPDLSGEPSRNLGCDSSKPVAFALEDPTAGRAFWLSMLPMCSRCTAPRKDELAAEATDSVGLAGRSRGTSDTAVFELDDGNASTTGNVGLLASRMPNGTDRDVPDPLIIASLLRKSSNGAPPALKSALIVRCERGVRAIGLLIISDTVR